MAYNKVDLILEGAPTASSGKVVVSSGKLTGVIKQIKMDQIGGTDGATVTFVVRTKNNASDKENGTTYTILTATQSADAIYLPRKGSVTQANGATGSVPEEIVVYDQIMELYCYSASALATDWHCRIYTSDC